jgi:hypothetical protein
VSGKAIYALAIVLLVAVTAGAAAANLTALAVVTLSVAVILLFPLPTVAAWGKWRRRSIGTLQLAIVIALNALGFTGFLWLAALAVTYQRGLQVTTGAPPRAPDVW